MRRLLTSLLALCLLSLAAWADEPAPLPDYVIAEFGLRPDHPTGPLPEQIESALEDVLAVAVDQSSWDPADTRAFDIFAQSNDPRLVWLITDMQRFAWRPEVHAALTRAASKILGTPFKGGRLRADIIDKMMAWDMPAYPGYLAHKRRIFTKYVPGWEKIFVQGDVTWHLVDWGGVKIDARPFGRTDEVCHCIPAADNPPVTTAAAATWLKDDDTVFGIVVNGEARAYPLRIMEVREMVNDTLGGRHLGIPYCTLCGAAQAYFTDRLPAGIKRPVLRTSGLLIRSNKVMYDINTHSIFDTFLGKALTGPLAEMGLQLDPVTVITSDWAAWRKAYPDTTALAEELALGRDYKLRETRDANGPIFPVGDVDPRLPVHENVIGALNAAGVPVAFPRAEALAALSANQPVTHSSVVLMSSASGLRAVAADGSDLASHEAFWFAWSQFHPETRLWSGRSPSE